MQKDDKTTPFLSVLLVIHEDGSLGHKVYRKLLPTHTDRYLHYNSLHHPSIKNSVCKTFIDRAKTICEVTQHWRRVWTFEKCFKNIMNGYPKKFIDNAIKTQQHVREKTENISLLSVYRILVQLHIKSRGFWKKLPFRYTILVKTSCFDLFAHIRIALMNFRNPVCTAFHVSVKCVLVYIGETDRNLSLRLKEHKTNCEKAELEKSAVAKYSWTNDHRIKWNEASILATQSHKFSRKMRESIEIEKHSTIDQEGKPLDSTWRALFTIRN